MMKLPKEVTHYFPYDTVRPQQDQFIKTVFTAVRDRRSVLIEGSNGLGKTISALSACLPTAVENDLKILYVARTHRQHDRVIEELRAVFRKYSVSGISLRGRHEMCLNNMMSRGNFDAKSLMEACELLKARGRCPYYKSADEQTYEYLHLQQQIAARPYKASEIQHVCRKREVCPYELAKAALSDIKVIALSYLYVFDPVIRTAFLKNLDTQLQKIILIVDEAHNLPETAIDISSSTLSLFVLKQAELEAQRFGNKEIEEFVNFFRSEIEKMTEAIGKEEIVSPETLIEIIQKQGSVAKPREFFEHLHEVGVSVRKSLLEEGKNPRSYIHGMSEFLLRWLETLGDESFVHVISKYYNREGAKTAKLEIVALDPSKITSPVFANTYSNIVMSGTLQPLEAYARITRLPENTVHCIVPSPFPKEHVLSLVCLGITTAMEKRTSDMYQTIIKRINEVVENTPANTGVFAASFEVLNSLIAEGLESALSKPLFHERRSMTSKVNEKLVAEFKECGEKDGAVFLGVQGGRTSEGVDFPGNQMNSVLIVGVPYAEPTPRVKAQITYYEKCFPKMGREYGYVLPAMKKASQAAGRPIRTLEDRGAIVFLDYRFATNYCRGFLPSWLTREMKCLPFADNVLADEVRSFFNP
ncbi:ATP-dependent DNA helicase [Candidatus Bathyarchaeota archaeon A05DMB-2]|jgi:DNA excision repair protein ERCC-2|nr:ATP-dependent DNA helicase [Candidatus Bathyarchaeota archaeon A05DMB-2]